MRHGATLLARPGVQRVLLLAVVSLLSGCGSSSGESATPYVLIQGQYVIAVGQTTQLVADTIHDTDATYAWACDDPDCAAVDDEGRVTGMAPGTARVTATGDQTGLESVCEITVVAGPDGGIPHYDEWRQSGHGDATTATFRVWDDLGEVPADCARCHSAYGFRDWIGDDGSAVGVVDAPSPLGATVECVACHNATTPTLDTVVFPSGAAHTGLHRETLCMECHGGRSSTDDLDAVVAAAGVPDDDTVSPALLLRTTHYMQGGATLLAGLARGGYQYEGKRYDGRFAHVGVVFTCTDCHDPHALDVDYTFCASCHAGISSPGALLGIRMKSSLTRDYDGDGDLFEGVGREIEGLLDLLHEAMRRYALDVTGFPIAYRPNPAPNFYEDANGNGVVDVSEETPDNQYRHWTARLVRAAYNLQFATNDRGSHVHNAKYVIQLLHDSIADLNATLTLPVAFAAADRDDLGHFDGSSDAARHWDGDGAVEADCARCHSGRAGFVDYLDTGTNLVAQPLANGLECEVCHGLGGSPGLRSMEGVDFPGGYRYEDAGNPSLLCMTCHTGRESKATLDAAIAANDLTFKNVHYLPAAGVLLGSAAAIGYEYAAHTYAGARWHFDVLGGDCLDCHGAYVTGHRFDVQTGISVCTPCHGTATVDDIRLLSNKDYDGDGSSSEPLAGEIEGLAADLLLEIQVVATAAAQPVAYDAHGYPYFFHDTNANGVVDGGEGAYGNAYSAWTPALMKAAHNYQISQKEPGAWAHNFAYTAQLLIDAIEDLGGDVSGYVRPTD